MASAVEANVFPAGFDAGCDARDFLGRGLGGDAHFLVKLADGGGFVGLAGVEVAGNAGVPQAGAHVFEERAFLEKKVAAFVENEDMDGAVGELLRVDFRAGGGADDLVVSIDHVEDFPGFLRHVFERMRVVGAGEIDPLCEREFLAADGGGDSEAGGGFLPRRAVGQLFFELLAALGEAAADELVKQPVVKSGQSADTRSEHCDAGVDFRLRVKRLGRHGAEGFHLPIRLCPQRENSVILGAGRRAEAIDDFLLQHDHRAVERVRAAE